MDVHDPLLLGFSRPRPHFPLAARRLVQTSTKKDLLTLLTHEPATKNS